jgi:LPS-assembly lipoprotein
MSSSSGRRAALAAVAAAALGAACGFHLRGDVSYSFASIFVRSAGAQPLATELRRALEAGGGAKVVDNAKDAAVTFELATVADDKTVLSLSSGGRAREYQLTKRVAFNLRDAEGREWMPAGEIVVRRAFTFSESEVLAREAEEARVLREMQTDAVQQIVRRLQAARKPT